MSLLLAAGALAATVAVVVHGGVGGRWLRAQLARAPLPSSSLFGDPDMSRRVLVVTWHAVTAVFAVTACTLALLALRGDEPRALLLFVSVLHAALLAVGLVVMAPRAREWLRPVPPLFALCMTTVAVTTALAVR